MLLVFYFLSRSVGAQDLVLVPDRVFDGEEIHEGWVVWIRADTIVAAGPRALLTIPRNAAERAWKGCTLLPGLIEGHSHMFLHPYDETPWNDQVLRENIGERVARATIHARKTLEAGFTTARDLGTEGAGYADIGLKQAIDKGIIPGPRLLVAGPAIVATGSYGPKGFAPHVEVPRGAAEADAVESLVQEVRRQIGHGVDLVKVYADYRWGPKGEVMPTFLPEELELIVRVARQAGRPVVAHATSEQAMRIAASAGVQTIEHGDEGTERVFAQMKKEGVALCPTLAAAWAISRYQGWDGQPPEPPRLQQKRRSFQLALEQGVTICAGGDAGVFAHGDNALELELMVDYGMEPIQALRSATSVNADVFGLADKVGRIKAGLLADLLIVEGDPSKQIGDLRNVMAVFKGGQLVMEKQ